MSDGRAKSPRGTGEQVNRTHSATARNTKARCPKGYPPEEFKVLSVWPRKDVIFFKHSFLRYQRF